MNQSRVSIHDGRIVTFPRIYRRENRCMDYGAEAGQTRTTVIIQTNFSAPIAGRMAIIVHGRLVSVCVCVKERRKKEERKKGLPTKHSNSERGMMMDVSFEHQPSAGP